MSVQGKLLDAYQIFLLCDRNIPRTLKNVKITRGTLLKYVRIQECLDFEVLEYLDKKGKEKLSLTEAMKLCDIIINPEQQSEYLKLFIETTKKDRVSTLRETIECSICMDTNPLFEYTPCCKTPICERCFTRTFATYIQDIIFKSIDCPFCKKSFDLRFVKWYLTGRFNPVTRTSMGYRSIGNELWRNTPIYHANRSHSISYQKNLYKKYTTVIMRIEDSQNYYLSDDSSDYKSLLGDEKYFGACSACTPKFIEGDPPLMKNRWRKIQICDIPKQCGNGEGGILVLEPDMFRCVVCKSREENYDNGEFKKCPHCGIKTIKPDGCNFIYCGDHRWCFICNERIENNAQGHNEHYWTGPGTSPYSNQCRGSVDTFEGDTFIIEGMCDCPTCNEHQGRPLCRTLECMERISLFNTRECDGKVIFHKYCLKCSQHQLDNDDAPVLPAP